MAMGRFVPLAVAAAASAARAEKQNEQDASIIGEFERPGINFILTTFFKNLKALLDKRQVITLRMKVFFWGFQKRTCFIFSK